MAAQYDDDPFGFKQLQVGLMPNPVNVSCSPSDQCSPLLQKCFTLSKNRVRPKSCNNERQIKKHQNDPQDAIEILLEMKTIWGREMESPHNNAPIKSLPMPPAKIVMEIT